RDPVLRRPRPDPRVERDGAGGAAGVRDWPPAAHGGRRGDAAARARGVRGLSAARARAHPAGVVLTSGSAAVAGGSRLLAGVLLELRFKPGLSGARPGEHDLEFVGRLRDYAERKHDIAAPDRVVEELPVDAVELDMDVGLVDGRRAVAE